MKTADTMRTEESSSEKETREATAKMKPSQRACFRHENRAKTLVVVAAFVCQMLSLGFAFSLGVFYAEFVESFPVGRGAVSWITSLCSGTLFGAGLVMGLIVKKVGPRFSCILGGLIAFVGVLSSSFVLVYPLLYVTFGVVTGSGLCLVQLSSAVSIGHHFTKGRAAATSLASVGSGIGALSFPVLLRFLIDTYTWRGALLIFSGVLLHAVPLGILFVPVTDKGSLRRNHDNRNAETDNRTLDEGASNDGPSDQPSSSKRRCQQTLCDVSMFKNSVYVVYLIICPIISTGYSFPYVTLVDLSLLRNINKQLGTLLLTYISIATAASTLLASFVLRVIHRHAIWLFTLSLVTMGSILFVFPSLMSYPALIGGSVAYGIAMGGLIGTYAVVVADMLGLNLYAAGFGFVCTGYGIGYLLGTPVAGWLTDLTGSYDTAFYIAGSLCLGSVVPLVIAQLVARFRRSSQFSITGLRSE